MSTIADLLDGGRFVSVQDVRAGWSDDRKYRVTTHDGTTYLLRTSSPDRAAHRRMVFSAMSQVDRLGVPICRPVELGTLDDGVYMVLEWIDGHDLRPLLAGLPTTRQYTLGVAAGRWLRRIHTIEAPDAVPAWSKRFNRKIDARLTAYRSCAHRLDGDHHLLRFLDENRNLLDDRPQTFQHGDFHDGNMMLSGHDLCIIDFDRADIGDPWEEFNRIVWPAGISPAFANGQLHGYFDGDPPDDFFRLLALYIATNTISSVPWAVARGRDEIETFEAQARDVLDWYDGMRTTLPGWYVPHL